MNWERVVPWSLEQDQLVNAARRSNERKSEKYHWLNLQKEACGDLIREVSEKFKVQSEMGDKEVERLSETSTNCCWEGTEGLGFQ